VDLLKRRLNDGIVLAALAMNFQLLQETIEIEFKSRLFLFLPLDDASIYKEPANQFPRTRLAFGSATNDIEEAYRCHALDRYTASVFHCMGILQYGLYSLAVNLKPPSRGASS
jgi:hypothetical protein